MLAGNTAQRYDGGMYYYTNTFGFAASARKVGRYYQPVDGFVQHADIAGYALYENKIWLFDKKSWLNSIQFGSFSKLLQASDNVAANIGKFEQRIEQQQLRLPARAAGGNHSASRKIFHREPGLEAAAG